MAWFVDVGDMLRGLSNKEVVMVGKRIEAFREWFTPRKRLWMGLGLFAITIVTPIISPGMTVTWLIGPASVFLIGSLIPDTSGKR